MLYSRPSSHDGGYEVSTEIADLDVSNRHVARKYAVELGFEQPRTVSKLVDQASIRLFITRAISTEHHRITDIHVLRYPELILCCDPCTLARRIDNAYLDLLDYTHRYSIQVLTPLN